MMSDQPDLFSLINNAVLDLQAADLQHFERPLRTLGGLLADPQLEAINQPLTEGLDLEAFLTESRRSQGSMVGSAQLAWPEDDKQTLGLTLLLIQWLGQNPVRQSASATTSSTPTIIRSSAASMP